MKTIIQGELIQNLCPIYVGDIYDFEYNPKIKSQKSKHLLFSELNKKIDNPRIIYTYTRHIDRIQKLLDCFENNFILVMHNCDTNITDTNHHILQNPKIIKVFTQNLCVDDSKYFPLPIGLANSMWPHGKPELIKQLSLSKINKFYFFFNIHTNKYERSNCYYKLNQKLQFNYSEPFFQYIQRLANTEFCICPVGNGVDSHRLWECFYTKTVPIVLDIPFYRILEKHFKLPFVFLNDWSEFDLNDKRLDYSLYNFDNVPYLENINLE
jgi:hypothetical protein